MTKIPDYITEDRTLKVEKALEYYVIECEERDYLGISGIGKSCPRALWYDFRLCTKKRILPRIQRIFSFGHRTEPYIVEDLEKAGMKVHSDQKEVITGHGHIKGHIDGIVENVPDAPKTIHLLELKTMNLKAFESLKPKPRSNKKPLLVKEGFLVYYTQVQCYMRLLKLERCLFIAECKDTSERYYERIKLDKSFADDALTRGVRIISTEVPPPKISDDPESWNFTTKSGCRYCDHNNPCHRGVPVIRNCRTCRNNKLMDDGVWKCGLNDIELSFEAQKRGCEKHEYLKGL